MNLESFGMFGLSFGGLTAIGVVAGFAAKKVAKLIAILAGIEFGLFALLEHQGIITVDWTALSAWLQPSPDIQATAMEVIASTGLLGGGFAAGFALGFKKA